VNGDRNCGPDEKVWTGDPTVPDAKAQIIGRWTRKSDIKFLATGAERPLKDEVQVGMYV